MQWQLEGGSVAPVDTAARESETTVWFLSPGTWRLVIMLEGLSEQIDISQRPTFV